MYQNYFCESSLEVLSYPLSIFIRQALYKFLRLEFSCIPLDQDIEDNQSCVRAA